MGAEAGADYVMDVVGRRRVSGWLRNRTTMFWGVHLVHGAETCEMPFMAPVGENSPGGGPAPHDDFSAQYCG